MKRTISILICLMLVLSMAIPAFAAGHNHTITINNSHDGYKYVAYQIFKGDLDHTGTLSNIKWGDGIDGAALLAELKALYPTEFATANDAEDVATALAKNGADDNEYAKNFADLAAKHVTTAAGTSSYADNKYTITGLEDGYYLIINTEVPAGQDNTTYGRYVLEVVADVEVKHKGTYPTVDKKIVEGENRVEVNEASIGDIITYEIVGTLPGNIADYDTYYYVFNDTLSKGLTFKEFVSVTVNGVVVTDYFYKNASEYDAVHGTTIKVGMQDLLALELLTTPAVGEITADTKVILTYNVTLNENAVIGVEGNPNLVDLEYSNNPNQDGEGATTPPPENPPEPNPVPEIPTGETPEEIVETFATELKIQKTDGAGAALKGAEFTLTGEGVNVVIVTGSYFEKVAEGTGDYWLLKNGTYTTTKYCDVDDPATTDKNENNSENYAETTANYKLVNKITVTKDSTGTNIKAFVDESGQLKFTGLGAGTYTLTETVTPSGFNTCDPITFEIKFDASTKKFTKIIDSSVLLDETLNTYHVTVKNVAGSKLPSTGGMGTTLFYAFGSVLFIGAAVLLITKKRMSA